MLACDCPPRPPLTHNYRAACIHDYLDAAARDYFIDETEYTYSDFTDYDANFAAQYTELIAIIRDLLALTREPYQSAALTQLSMMLITDYSLCPAHRIDYAICFDDDDPDCTQIRACFPSHDT